MAMVLGIFIILGSGYYMFFGKSKEEQVLAAACFIAGFRPLPLLIKGLVEEYKRWNLRTLPPSK